MDWYTSAALTPVTRLTRMQRLRWETAPLPGTRGRQVQRCDMVAATNIAEPVYIMADPTDKAHFFFNHHMRVGGR